ncbi:MAG: S41 family peptidase [Lachnospiraceae bacterium]|nr:S41 family peptidase [Lachnospiraceae bacterium]
MKKRNARNQSFWSGFFWGLAVMLALMAAGQLVLRYTDVGNRLSAGLRAGTARRAVSERETRGKLNQLANIIDKLYYKETEDQQIKDGVYSGLMDSLGDPYSEYYAPQEYQALIESTSGSYCGIGIVLSQNKETMDTFLFHVYPGTPAMEAGLEEGDIIQAVDGDDLQGEEISLVSKQLRGEEGSQVHLQVLREQGKKTVTLEFDVERRQVEIPTVESQMLKGGTGFVQISEFTDLTSSQFRQALEELRGQDMTSLIVDVRGNPGGVLDGVCEVLDMVLPEGLLVYTEDKYGNRTDYTSTEEEYLNLPIAVLVDKDSASASEIFAGAIKDHDYGTLIGTRTFGKGIVQQIVPLIDGSAVKVTTARYFTPNGNNIHEVGIEPDIELEYEYLGAEEEAYDPMKDNQVQKALEVLKKESGN